MKTKHIQHLYWRIGFGISPDRLKVLSKKDKSEVVNALFSASKNPMPLKIDTSELTVLVSDMMSEMDKRKNIMDFQKLSREKTIELNVAWVDRLSKTDQLLREKMTLFWSNHFVCEDNNFIFTQQFHNTLREYALGNFGDFVKAVSKEAAMTKYLNTKQNKKEKPNENFARELMELFTLGVGHYTEHDIKESAKAFTGYSHDVEGNFVLRRFQHDNGDKTFFAKTGDFTGDDIIDIILEQKQCARYICEKLYRYFVNDDINVDHINDMVNVFYLNYDIEKLMRHVFMSDWFYDDQNIGSKIKSPIEFLVGIKTMVPVEFNNSKQLLYIQKVLGQILFNPPNVAGWKGGRSWIDSNTIVMRLKLPSILLNNAYISKMEAGMDDDSMAIKKEIFKKAAGKRFNTTADWSFFNNQFQHVDINDIGNYLILCDMNETTSNYLRSLEKVSKREYCVQLMSLPEYQMC